jgi:hypothetical protein
MDVADWRFPRMKSLIERAVAAVLEELPFICTVVIAVGSWITITLYCAIGGLSQ